MESRIDDISIMQSDHRPASLSKTQYQMINGLLKGCNCKVALEKIVGNWELQVCTENIVIPESRMSLGRREIVGRVSAAEKLFPSFI